jgi:N-acetylmuramoyl-L-alanine amidase
MAVQLPSLGEAARIDWRAGRISDPVKRLRYLRGQMSQDVVPVVRERRKSWRVNHLAWLALPAILALLPGPSPKGSAEIREQERGLAVPRADGSAPVGPVPRVWLVERSEATEVYSNGLRVDLTFLTPNRPRAHFPIYSLAGASTPVKFGNGPVGIVFHTTESLIAPFEEDANRRLRQLGRNLMEVVRSERAYHFVIDRFGRVYAVVKESDAANHSGNSVWADADGIYVNLNDSFLGVSFEAQTGATDEVTPAQIQSAKVLTEALRSRYGIPAENCVTHAQVSVNPRNMRVGEHTDWAGNFPFAQVGLPNNYAVPLASVYAFGFESDATYDHVVGLNFSGVALALQQVEKQAAAENTPVAQYRAMLRHRYKDIAANLKESEGEN